ncbi:MAG: DUF3307 domain-containing protein [Verrucomicrobiales bacterium]
MGTLFGEILIPGASGIGSAAVLLFALVIGHSLADFPLQGEFLAIGKEMDGRLDEFTGSTWPTGTWAACLTFHALIHGGMVWAISGSVRLGAVEFVLHWLIDLAKSAGLMGFFVDQSLHILCKIAYVYLLFEHQEWFLPV